MPVIRKGRGLSRAKLENAQKRGLILGAKLVAQRATALAPIDTGRLKRSLTHSSPKQLGPGHFSIDVGTNVEYAAIQEFGIGVPPQPYLTPAFEASKKAITRLIAINIVRALKR